MEEIAREKAKGATKTFLCSFFLYINNYQFLCSKQALIEFLRLSDLLNNFLSCMCTKKSIQLSKTAMHFPVGKANTFFYFLNLVQSLSHLMTGPDMSRQLWLLHGSIQGTLYRWTEHLADFLFLNSNWGREKGPPNYTPGVYFLDHDRI